MELSGTKSKESQEVQPKTLAAANKIEYILAFIIILIKMLMTNRTRKYEELDNVLYHYLPE